MIDEMVSSVLVVDDDPDFLALATRILHEMGVEEISTARSAATALAEADASRPRAALVDIGLPDRDGIDLARELAGLPWSPRVVLTSTDSEPGSTESLPFLPKEELTDGALRKLFSDA
jgi:DNA-binding response OmpR family regulator